MSEEASRARGLKGRVVAALGAMAVVMTLSVVTAPAAYAGDATCIPTRSGGVCGQIHNKGATTIKVATNYTSPTKVGSLQRDVKAGGSTTSHTAAKGWYRDWDAFYVPAGSCAQIRSGVGHAFTSTNNRVGKSGVWHKVDGWGATVKVKAGKCP